MMGSMRKVVLALAALLVAATLAVVGRADAHTICETTSPGGTVEGTLETAGSGDVEDPATSLLNTVDQLVLGQVGLFNLVC